MQYVLRHFGWLCAVGALVVASGTSAQPDIREIKPHVMLLLDTSGSMNRKPECGCTTNRYNDCVECMPTCNFISGVYEKNRWAYVVEALTGEWGSFGCFQEPRSGVGGWTQEDYANQYDEGFHLNHVLLPDYSGGAQTQNGILDTYIDRAKFGVMTMDTTQALSVHGTTPQAFSVLTTGWGPVLDTGTFYGPWSYGPVKPFKYDGDDPATTYGTNLGVRGPGADEGALVSVGADADYATTNAAVQTSILGDGDGVLATSPGAAPNPVRPWSIWQQPIGAMMTDLEYYMENTDEVLPKVVAADSKDIYYECRERVGILITDDKAFGEFRDTTYDCTTGASSYCPYEEADTVVTRMLSDGDLTKLYVVGFATDGNTVQKAAIKTYLDDLASAGGTGDAIIIESGSSDHLGELKAALASILDQVQPGNTSRTAPVPSAAKLGKAQARILSGFDPAAGAGDPWTGVLERRRTECSGDVAEEQDIDDVDRFHEVLNDQTTRPSGVTVYSSATAGSAPAAGFTRNLWTVDPSSGTGTRPDFAVSAANKESIAGNGAAEFTTALLPVPSGSDVTVPTVLNATPVPVDTTLHRDDVGAASDAERDDVINHLHGQAGSAREDKRLGAIYHSTPVIVEPLQTDIANPSFNAYRLGLGHQDPADGTDKVLNERPRTLYAASNDGIIHAFSVDAYGTGEAPAGFSCFDGKPAGTELWGFVPPMLVPELSDLLTGHQWMTDGNLIVKDVFDYRAINDNAAAVTNAWRTVMVAGFRQGGKGIVALDVTNPCEPEFLWQLTDGDMGLTYGDPAITQLLIQDGGRFNGDTTLQTRGVVIVPGGYKAPPGGTTAITGGSAADASATTDTGASKRLTRRTWDSGAASGRALYVVDLITGTILRKFDDSVFPAPLSGAVSVFRGGTGGVASRAFFTDADGVIWRLALRDPDPDNWEVVAFHDMFYDRGASDAEPAYAPPVLTTRPDGRVVILQASGDPDALDDTTAQNRVVSLTETLTFDADGLTTDVSGEINWEIEADATPGANDLEIGEQITGPIELFSGNVFFSSFKSAASDPLDACIATGSRIWGVSYLDDGSHNVVPKLDDSGTPVSNLDGTDISALDGTVLVGVRVEQELSCETTASTTFNDPYLGSRTVDIAQSSNNPVFKLVGSISGAGTTLSGASLGEVDQTVVSPFAKVVGYIGTVN